MRIVFVSSESSVNAVRAKHTRSVNARIDAMKRLINHFLHKEFELIIIFPNGFKVGIELFLRLLQVQPSDTTVQVAAYPQTVPQTRALYTSSVLYLAYPSYR